MSVCMYVTFLLILPSPKVFPPDDLPRPSRPKAGLGLVMMMMMMVMVMMMVVMMVLMMRARREK